MLYKLQGHNDTITGLALSPNGAYLLSNAMDNTCKFMSIKIMDNPYYLLHIHNNIFTLTSKLTTR